MMLQTHGAEKNKQPSLYREVIQELMAGPQIPSVPALQKEDEKRVAAYKLPYTIERSVKPKEVAAFLQTKCGYPKVLAGLIADYLPYRGMLLPVSGYKEYTRQCQFGAFTDFTVFNISDKGLPVIQSVCAEHVDIRHIIIVSQFVHSDHDQLRKDFNACFLSSTKGDGPPLPGAPLVTKNAVVACYRLSTCRIFKEEATRPSVQAAQATSNLYVVPDISPKTLCKSLCNMASYLAHCYPKSNWKKDQSYNEDEKMAISFLKNFSKIETVLKQIIDSPREDLIPCFQNGPSAADVESARLYALSSPYY